MKSEDFLDDLGSNFTKDTGYNNGYPILTFGQYTVKPEEKKEDEETDNSESTTVKAIVVGDTATAEVPPEEITRVLEVIKDSPEGNVVISVVGDTGANVKTVEVDLIVASLKEIVAAGNYTLKIENSIATVTFDHDTIAGIAENKRDDEVVKIIVTKVDTVVAAEASLTDEQKEIVGENFVIDLTVKVGNVVIHNFKGEVTVVVPFTPPKSTPEKDYDLLTVYFVDDEGKLTEIGGVTFDAKAKTMTFKTKHFSKFMISEWVNPFSDVPRDAWYYKSVRFGVSRELVTGSDGKFLPMLNSSRATMITLLAKLSGYDATGSEPWYDKAMQWGVTVGITDGTNPTNNITREQLFQLLYNFSKMPTVPRYDLSTYVDAPDIHDWALPGMEWAVSTGLVTGRTPTMLAPRGFATRSEVVALFQKFLVEFYEANQ
jgi:hypothetical protein